MSVLLLSVALPATPLVPVLKEALTTPVGTAGAAQEAYVELDAVNI